MRTFAGKTYWLVGASEGLGRALAHLMSRAGVEVIVSLLSNEETTFEGRHFTLSNARNEPKGPQRPHPPIVIGGGGEKRTLRTVAKFAQHWNMTPTGFDQWKNKGVLPAEAAENAADLDAERAAEVYAVYQRLLADANALDFGDLLLQTTLLFERGAGDAARGDGRRGEYCRAGPRAARGFLPGRPRWPPRTGSRARPRNTPLSRRGDGLQEALGLEPGDHDPSLR